MSGSPLTVTARAQDAIEKVIRESGRNRILRVAFLYGCGGAGYRTSLESHPMEGDLVFREGCLELALEPIVADTLAGGIVDCLEGDEGPELIIDHPNALGAPLCGW